MKTLYVDPAWLPKLLDRRRPMRKIVAMNPPGIYTDHWTFMLSCGHLVPADVEGRSARQRIRCKFCPPKP